MNRGRAVRRGPRVSEVELSVTHEVGMYVHTLGDVSEKLI